jgi:hypothetical protein
MWFPLKSKLRPAYRVRVRCHTPRQDWIIFVDGDSGRILRKYDNLAEATGVAFVFDPNPAATLAADQLPHHGRTLPPPETAYTRVTLRGLNASGWLDGRRVTTKPTKRRTRQPNRQFLFRSNERAFEEVMAYFHIDRAVTYLESLGFRGPRAIFRAPLPVDANGTDEDNSWFGPHDSSLTFGLGGVDDAEDAEIILHELGHAIQDAICPGFGQSTEAAAMGEGFGDYFAASFCGSEATALSNLDRDMGRHRGPHAQSSVRTQSRRTIYIRVIRSRRERRRTRQRANLVGDPVGHPKWLGPGHRRFNYS